MAGGARSGSVWMEATAASSSAARAVPSPPSIDRQREIQSSPQTATRRRECAGPATHAMAAVEEEATTPSKKKVARKKKKKKSTTKRKKKKGSAKKKKKRTSALKKATVAAAAVAAFMQTPPRSGRAARAVRSPGSARRTVSRSPGSPAIARLLAAAVVAGNLEVRESALKRWQMVHCVLLKTGALFTKSGEGRAARYTRRSDGLAAGSVTVNGRRFTIDAGDGNAVFCRALSPSVTNKWVRALRKAGAAAERAAAGGASAETSRAVGTSMRRASARMRAELDAAARAPPPPSAASASAATPTRSAAISLSARALGSIGSVALVGSIATIVGWWWFRSSAASDGVGAPPPMLANEYDDTDTAGRRRSALRAGCSVGEGGAAP